MKMHAPPKPAYPILEPTDLPQFDAFILGIPTRYGNFPAQWKAFWDATGGLWGSGALTGKYVSAFVSSASPGGGQEATIIASLSTFVHHGLIFVPLGYAKAFAQLTNVSEVRGGEYLLHICDGRRGAGGALDACLGPTPPRGVMLYMGLTFRPQVLLGAPVLSPAATARASLRRSSSRLRRSRASTSGRPSARSSSEYAHCCNHDSLWTIRAMSVW